MSTSATNSTSGPREELISKILSRTYFNRFTNKKNEIINSVFSKIKHNENFDYSDQLSLLRTLTIRTRVVSKKELEAIPTLEKLVQFRRNLQKSDIYVEKLRFIQKTFQERSISETSDQPPSQRLKLTSEQDTSITRKDLISELSKTKTIFFSYDFAIGTLTSVLAAIHAQKICPMAKELITLIKAASIKEESSYSFPYLHQMTDENLKILYECSQQKILKKSLIEEIIQASSAPEEPVALSDQDVLTDEE